MVVENISSGHAPRVTARYSQFGFHVLEHETACRSWFPWVYVGPTDGHVERLAAPLLRYTFLRRYYDFVFVPL